MKKFFIPAIIIVVGLAAYIMIAGQEAKPAAQIAGNKNTMILSSSAFPPHGTIPRKFTCDGENINPDLQFHNMPENARSFALIVDDPDAPGGTWVHWLVWNIDPATTLIKENNVPPNSVEGVTSFGRPGYGGPCPPAGKPVSETSGGGTNAKNSKPEVLLPGKPHRYFFKLYALDTMLGLKPSAKKNEIEAAMAGHVLAQTELVGLYGR